MLKARERYADTLCVHEMSTLNLNTMTYPSYPPPLRKEYLPPPPGDRKRVTSGVASGESPTQEVLYESCLR